MLDLLTLLVLCCSVEHGKEGGGGSPHCGSHPSCGVHHLFDLGLSVQSWFSGKTESVSVQRIERLFWDIVLHFSRWHNCHGIKIRCNYWMFDFLWFITNCWNLFNMLFEPGMIICIVIKSHLKSGSFYLFFNPDL